MDVIFNHQEERERETKLCLPLVRSRDSDSSSPFSIFGFWISKSIRKVCNKIRLSSGVCSGGLHYNGMVVNNSTFFCASPEFMEDIVMETLIAKKESKEEKCEVFDEFLTSETTAYKEQNHGRSGSSSPLSMGWPLHQKAAEEGTKLHIHDRKLERQVSSMSETEMMKERFSKLLLGEDMSGCGNGVSTALAISNAITNLCATLFGQLWRLEPLPAERKAMWRREMELLLCVSNHIVELIPIWQTFPDGSKLEIMTCRPRSDLYVNLPALRKLDHMLLDVLDSFVDSEFWYVDQGILAPEADESSSFRKVLERQEDKWWLPIPRVPARGLSENSRRQLQHKRDCTNQILKAAMAINAITLADMDVPESYLEALPKNGRASLGEAMYRYISSDEFSPVCLLDCLDISSEHKAIEIANRVEAAMYAWRKGVVSKLTHDRTRSSSKSSWEMIKELVIDADKSELFAERAEAVLVCLRQRFPNLPQTSLDMSKIQYNKDVGKAIIESYSRVLESLAFNIVARIDELLYVDDMTKHSEQIPCISQLGIIAQHSNAHTPIQFTVPFSSSPYRTTSTTPSFLTRNPVGHAKAGGRSPSPILIGTKVPRCVVGVKRVSTNNICIEENVKGCGDLIERVDLVNETAHQSDH